MDTPFDQRSPPPFTFISDVSTGFYVFILLVRIKKNSHNERNLKVVIHLIPPYPVPTNS